MLLKVSMLEDETKLIILEGRMDIIGTQEIDTRLTVAIASEGTSSIVDLSGVEFMSSLGIGVLVRAANALIQRKGKMVFLNPQSNVLHALESTAITKVVPVFNDIELAKTYLKN